MKTIVFIKKAILRCLQIIGVLTILFCALIMAAIIKHDFSLNVMRNLLIVDEEPEKSDVIVILSGYDMSKRVDHGIKLYDDGYSNMLLMAGGPQCSWNTSCPEIMKEQAVNHGVPQEAILTEPNSTTTYENAKYTLKILEAEGFKSAIIVTSALHSNRSRKIFNRVYSKKNISLVICAVPDLDTATEMWWKSELEIQKIANEYMKLLYFYLFQKK